MDIFNSEINIFNLLFNSNLPKAFVSKLLNYFIKLGLYVNINI